MSKEEDAEQSKDNENDKEDDGWEIKKDKSITVDLVYVWRWIGVFYFFNLFS